MPTDSGKPIEDRLRAYAARRREASGPPCELHPVDRRRLQAEVARVWRSAGSPAPESLLKLLGRMWPRFVFAFSMLVILGLIAWRLTDSVELPQQVALVERDRSGVGQPADESLDLGAPELELMAVSPDAQNLPAAAPVSEMLRAAPPMGAEPQAPTVAAVRGAAVVGEKAALGGSVVGLEPAPAVGARGEQVAGDGVRAQAEAAPGSAPVTGRSDALAANEVLATAMVDTARIATVTHRFKQSAAAEAQGASAERDEANPVLQTFRVERAGRQLRIVDADGSVYEGLMAAPASVAEPAGTEALSMQPARASAGGYGIGLGSTEEQWRFEARGTNRTLQQPVSIRGVLLAGSAGDLGGDRASGSVEAGRAVRALKRSAPAQPAKPQPRAAEVLSAPEQPDRAAGVRVQLEQRGAWRIVGEATVGVDRQVAIRAISEE